ncbi:hypothetical protein JL721_2982 [Aureococcus anophagefferens]|nr:hypothetical protein JL721_2982 [Aureococcus anophagefferens]
MAANVQQEAEEEIAAYKELQGHINTLMQSRGRFLQQKSENEMVRGELEIGKDDAAVYKLVGPVLFKQEMDDVKENVKAKQEEQETLGEAIMKKQSDMRAKAAEEARRPEQTKGM